VSSKLSSYRIIFTEFGERKQVWDGYASYGEARRAIIDADLIIPFHWDHTIEEYQPETQGA
jgi:L-ascorbate metabolism protein UlaG (beta-lactamase superfamily)